MASKDKYKSLLERYKQTLIKNPKLNLSAYCRLNGVSVSGMHHYIEDVGQSVKSIRDAVRKRLHICVDVFTKTGLCQKSILSHLRI